MLIKISMPGQGASLNLSQFTGNETNSLDGAQFRINEKLEKADAWFIFEDVDPDDHSCEVPQNQVHFLSAEGSWNPDKFLSPAAEKFLSQFATAQTCHPTRNENSVFTQPFLPWMVNANHESIFSPHSRDINYLRGLDDLSKDAPLSVFCSAQTWTPTHKLRFAFAEHLKNYFGDDIAWFGNGVNPLPEKWDGLARFERTVVLENRSDHTNFTEKILDPFLTLTVPIYWGAPNIRDFLPVEESHQINIHSFQDATERIAQLIRKPVDESDREKLREGRDRVLNELHFLRRIVDIARRNHVAKEVATFVSLRPKSEFVASENPETRLRQRMTSGLHRWLAKPVYEFIAGSSK